MDSCHDARAWACHEDADTIRRSDGGNEVLFVAEDGVRLGFVRIPGIHEVAAMDLSGRPERARVVRIDDARKVLKKPVAIVCRRPDQAVTGPAQVVG